MFITTKNELYKLFDTPITSFVSNIKSDHDTMKIDDNHLVLKFNVPGFSKSDFEITIRDNALVIEGHIETQTFFKSYNINKNWDFEKTSAEVKNGILTLKIPKKQIDNNIIKISVN